MNNSKLKDFLEARTGSPPIPYRVELRVVPSEVGRWNETRLFPSIACCSWIFREARAYPFPLKKSRLPNVEALLGVGRKVWPAFVNGDIGSSLI